MTGYVPKFWDGDAEGMRCVRCGKDGLHWDDGVLMEGRFKVHKCSEADLHAQAADDFEELG